MAKHISFFGGPGCGKSTASAGVFYKMKKKGYTVELVTEYAKDLVYREDFNTLSDQIMVFAEQHNRWFKLDQKVDFTVSDAPFLLSTVYAKEGSHLNLEKFKSFVINTYKNYDTVNIFIERNEENFQEFGRNENLKESIELDKKILKILDDNGIKYHKIKAGKSIDKEIFKKLKELGIV
jgi:hypothetical protein